MCFEPTTPLTKRSMTKLTATFCSILWKHKCMHSELQHMKGWAASHSGCLQMIHSVTQHLTKFSYVNRYQNSGARPFLTTDHSHTRFGNVGFLKDSINILKQQSFFFIFSIHGFDCYRLHSLEMKKC